IKSSKRVFFDNRIKEIATTNARPWDLRSPSSPAQWKLPPTDAISFQGRQCRTLDELWQALHGTYNGAAEREIDLSFLDDLVSSPERTWFKFSALELRDTLSVWSSHSVLGPDHVMWLF
ncbi:hypothetical protein L218DRAFT_809370, partial [Marasmius fiardii PR-910]